MSHTSLAELRKKTKNYLQKKHFYSRPDNLLTSQIFIENTKHYLEGKLSLCFFSNLADELLYTALKQKKNQIDEQLFSSLMCASELENEESQEQLNIRHQQLKQYLSESRPTVS